MRGHKMSLGPITPILRIFDEAKALEFYVDFLGFTVDFQHRFEEGLPLYMQVSREGCALHLSEHHGDASPGSHVRIQSPDVEALHAELTARQYRYGRPNLEDKPWKTRELATHDPFGNRLTFWQPQP